MEKWRTWAARLFGVGCIALGIIGLIVGFSDSTWKLGAEGYFTGGTLLGVVALIFMADEFMDQRR
jgi:hypothetical protein